MNCDTTTFPDFLSNCQETIDVYALLLPGTSYEVVITDKFQKAYKANYITDANGFLELGIADYPDGLFNEHAGDFKLEIFTSLCQKVSFRITKYYDSIKFNVEGGTREKNHLGCPFDCVDGTVGTGSAIFQFEDDAIFSITWNSFLNGLYGPAPNVQVYHETSPGVFQIVTVGVTLNGGVYDLTSIEIDNGGPADGFVIIS